jgi:hypothetical protein
MVLASHAAWPKATRGCWKNGLALGCRIGEIDLDQDLWPHPSRLELARHDDWGLLLH